MSVQFPASILWIKLQVRCICVMLFVFEYSCTVQVAVLRVYLFQWHPKRTGIRGLMGAHWCRRMLVSLSLLLFLYLARTQG